MRGQIRPLTASHGLGLSLWANQMTGNRVRECMGGRERPWEAVRGRIRPLKHIKYTESLTFDSNSTSDRSLSDVLKRNKNWTHAHVWLLNYQTFENNTSDVLAICSTDGWNYSVRRKMSINIFFYCALVTVWLLILSMRQYTEHFSVVCRIW